MSVLKRRYKFFLRLGIGDRNESEKAALLFSVYPIEKFSELPDFVVQGSLAMARGDGALVPAGGTGRGLGSEAQCSSNLD